MGRRKRKSRRIDFGKGYQGLTKIAGLGAEVKAFIANKKKDAYNLAIKDKNALEDRNQFNQNVQLGKDAFGAVSGIVQGVNMMGNTTKNIKLRERFPGLDENLDYLEQARYEVNPEWQDMGMFEGNLPFGKRPKWRWKGSDRVQETQEYLDWVAEGSIDYADEGMANVIREQKKMMDTWTESDSTFQVSTTQDGYVPGQDIVMGGQQPGGGPGNMIGAKVGQTSPFDTVPMTDYLMDESTMIGGDIGQQFGIGKNSRGQIIDLESGAVMDEKLLNARINLKKTEADLAISEKPAITTIDKPKTIDPVKDVYTNKKVEGWKGKLGVYDTASGFKADYGRTDNFSASWKGQGWTEVQGGEGVFGSDLGYDFGLGDALAVYNIYDNATTTDWDGHGMAEWSHDEWGAGIQMLGSALYFVPVPGARVVGGILNVVGAGIEKYGGTDEDFWFGENSLWGAIF